MMSTYEERKVRKKIRVKKSKEMKVELLLKIVYFQEQEVVYFFHVSLTNRKRLFFIQARELTTHVNITK